MGYIFKFIRWLIEKFAAAALIVALGLAALGLWLFLKDNVDFDQWRDDVVRNLFFQANGRFRRYGFPALVLTLIAGSAALNWIVQRI